MEVGQWFSGLGLPPPININLADFVLDLASGEDIVTYETGEHSRLRCIAAAETFKEEHPEGFCVDVLDTIENIHEVC